MNTNEFNHDAWQDIRQAVRKDDLQEVLNLLSKHPDLLHVNTPLGTCLHFAAGKGCLQIVKSLVELGADVDLSAEVSASPLDRAAAKGHLDVVKYLFEKGARLDVSSPDKNQLFSAIYGGHIGVARFLLESGIDPHVVYTGQSGKLKNSLSYAQECAQTEIAEILIAAGCQLPVEDVDVPVTELDVETEGVGEPFQKQIIAGMAKQFGPVDALALQEIVPVDDLVHVSIHAIHANDQHPYLTLFTTGMSDRPMQVPEGQEAFQYAELVMYLPATWPVPANPEESDDSFWPFEWLRKIAYYPHNTETWLGGPHTIIATDDPPVPLGSNTQQSCLLLLADLANWSPMILDNGIGVKFYTVIPIYVEERDFEVRHGIQALLKRLQERGHTAVAEPDRTNAAVG